MSDPLPGDRVDDKSIGELFALASSNVTDLIRAEMNLARLELKADAKKGAMGAVMLVIATVMGGIIVMMLSFSLAYGLIAVGLWDWFAFLVVAIVYALLALALMWLARRIVKKITGPKRTQKTLKDDLSALRHRKDSGAPELTG